MPCYHPVPAYQNLESGQVFFSALRKYAKEYKEIILPCGQCVGCQSERARQWAVRCTHEASLYPFNEFITLTYSDKFLPPNGSLQYSDFQGFMKRLRRVYHERVRFFMCGEYGGLYGRPHYHALLFNHNFDDKLNIRQLDSGCDVYRSKQLEHLWPYGNSCIGTVTFNSANYIARYCVKKFQNNAEQDKGEMTDVRVPEFIHMSLKPGIGKKWLDKYKKDVYTYDYVIVNGHETKPPKYYDKQLDETELEEIKYLRYLKADEQLDHTTPQRLADRETVAKARLQFYKRTLT